MKDALEKMYQNALTSMNRVLTGHDGLSAEDIVEYRRNADLFDNMESIIRVHFKPNEIISSRALIQNVIDNLQEKLVELDQVELSDPRVSTYLANALLIRDAFKEENEFIKVYDSVCEAFLNRYKKLAQQVRKILDEDDEINGTVNIQVLAESLKALNKSAALLRSYLNEQIVVKLYTEILMQVVEHYEKISKPCELMMVTRQRLSAQDFKQLEVALMQLNSASDNLILQELCKMKLKDVYDKLLNAIIA